MLDIKKHKVVLIKILKNIYSNIKISSILGFKGGTALNLFYNLPRFSVDLDFNLLDNKKEKLVFDEVYKILKRFLDIKENYNKKFTLIFIGSYERGERGVKIEISKKSIPASYEIKYYLGIPILVMKKEDMFANKLVAITERKKIANRDIFDIWFMLDRNWNINENIIKMRTGDSLKTHLKKIIKILEQINNRYILQGIGDLLDNKTKIWVKNNLKKETIFLLKLRIKQENF